MAVVGRRARVLLSVVLVLMAVQAGPAVVAHADDVLPPVAFTTTSNAPLHNGGTYGIGTVIVAHFEAPVGDRGLAEQALQVDTSPPVAGAWHWVDDRTMHWRPPQYYAPGTVVTVTPGPGAPVSFTIGASHISIADDATKQVTVFDGGGSWSGPCRLRWAAGGAPRKSGTPR